VLSISENLTSKGLNAGSIISLIAKSAGGSGGGRPNIALGGAKDAGRLNVIKEEAKRVLTMEIKK
jgi:alanyl-tRNA synthetase